MIAITGANGNLGQSTIQVLLNKTQASNIVAIMRSPDKFKGFENADIEIRQADYDNFNTLKVALKDVSTLLQISTTSTGDVGKQQEKNVVLAAKEQGVNRIVYTSSLTPKSSACFLATHQALATEQEILKSGIHYTFFRNSLYMEAIPQLIGNALQDGQIYYPAGSGKVSFVSRIDIAEALANVLTEAGHKNKTYEITGNKAYSFQEIAKILSKEKNLQATYSDISDLEMREQLISYQTPLYVIDLLVSMANAIKSGEFSYIENTLGFLLRREPISLSEYIKSI